MTSQRQTIWVDTLTNSSAASGGQLIVDLNLQNVNLRGATILRTIVCHDYTYTVHDSGEGSQMLDIGIAVASEEAFVAQNLPDPATAPDFPLRGWIYRCRHILHGFAADQAAIETRSVFRDLRSQRKVDNGHPYMIMDNTPVEGVASVIRLVGITRQLFLLP